MRHLLSLLCCQLQDVIGKSLNKIGAYGELDPTAQVVAVIDEVGL